MYGNRPLLAQGDPAVYQALHLNATLDLVLERRRIAHDTVPELYRHDVHRLFKYQTEFYYITVTMGIISIAGPACQFDEDKMEVNLDFFYFSRIHSKKSRFARRSPATSCTRTAAS